MKNRYAVLEIARLDDVEAETDAEIEPPGRRAAADLEDATGVEPGGSGGERPGRHKEPPQDAAAVSPPTAVFEVAEAAEVPRTAEAGQSDAEAGRSDADEAQARPSRAVRMLRWLGCRKLAVAALIVIAAMAAGLYVTTSTIRQDDAMNGVRSSALKAASSYATDLGSYNYLHLKQDFGVVQSNSTASFRQSFTESSDALTSVLSKYHATASASVVATGLVMATPAQAVVIVFLNQVVNNDQSKSSTTDHSRLELTLDRSKGQWLIDQVKLL